MSKPTHLVSAKVATNKDGKGVYKYIGSAWKDAAKNQMTVKLDTIPVTFDGYMTLFPNDEKD